jgi:hypothetical protein
MPGTARAKSATRHDAHAACRRRPAAPSFALTNVRNGIVTSSCRALVADEPVREIVDEPHNDAHPQAVPQDMV